MQTLFYKNRFTRLQKLLLAAIAAAIVWLLSEIPVLAEHLFARGITRALNFLLGKISALFPFSLYELTAFLLIFGAAALVVGVVLLLKNRQFARLKI